MHIFCWKAHPTIENYCTISGKDFREFRREELGECGGARMGIDLDGDRLAVLYSEPDILGRICVVKVWKDGNMVYMKTIGKCDGGDVFLSENGVESAFVKDNEIYTSWGGTIPCSSPVYRGEWIQCGESKVQFIEY
jgi:hypothetical protein